MRSIVIVVGLALWAGSAGMAGAAENAPAEAAQDQVQHIKGQIARMLADPLSEEALSAQTDVVNFAKESDRIFITISPKFFEFTESPYDSMLMAHYLAGATLYDLDHPDRAKDELADVPSALDSTAKLYRALRAKDPKFQHPFFDIIDERAQKGELEQLVQELDAEPADESDVPTDLDLN